jgi:hypothetical protein
MPSMQGFDDEDEALQDLTALTLEDKPVDVFSTPPKLEGELVTLTLLPRSRWQTLLNLDVIQVSLHRFHINISLNDMVLSSNVINQKNLQKPRNKPLSSSPLSRELRHDLL